MNDVNDEITELNKLILELRNRNKFFKDKSRFYTCITFSLLVISFLILFYIFDVLKYESTCLKSKKSLLEICEAPTLNFWTRFIVLSVSFLLLTISFYFTGDTVVIINPSKDLVVVNKKKLFILPSIVEFKLTDLIDVILDSTDMSNIKNRSLSSFYFSSVVFIFKEEKVSLSLGRDCFFINNKLDLVNDINNYLFAIKQI